MANMIPEVAPVIVYRWCCRQSFPQFVCILMDLKRGAYMYAIVMCKASRTCE